MTQDPTTATTPGSAARRMLFQARGLLAPAGSRRERLAQSLYGPVIDALPDNWRRRLKSPGTMIPEIVYFHDLGVENGRRAPIQRIVVFKLDHIGDLVVGMRAMRMLREGFPDAHMTLVCATWNETLAHGLGWFDRIVGFDFFTPRNRDWSGAGETLAALYASVATLKLDEYDLAVDLRHDADTRPCLYRVTATYRAGFHAPAEAGLPGLDLMLPFSEGMDAGEGLSRSLHADLRLQLLAAAIVSTFATQRPHPANLLAPAGGGAPPAAPFTVLAIGAGDPIRLWPIARYAEIGRALMARHGMRIVILCGPADADDGRRLAALLPADDVQMVIGAELATLPKLMAGAALCVCNGSGMSHLAAALNVPTVCILGGTTRMEVWHPAGARAISIGGRTRCQPCGLHEASQCLWDVTCLKSVDSALVLDACDRVLGTGSLALSAGEL